MSQYYAVKSQEISELEIKNQQRVRAMAGECMVLLENDGILPLKNDIKRIALFGSGIRHTIKGGTGSGDVNSRTVINIERGIEDAGLIVTSKKWLDKYDKIRINSEKEYLKKLKSISKDQNITIIEAAFNNNMVEPEIPIITKDDISDCKCTTAVFVLTRNSGEGHDRNLEKGDYYLTDGELDSIKFLADNFNNTIVILNIGGIIDLSELKKISNINAILLAGQSGSISGNIISDVLTGKSIPSGKLTDTWAISYSDYPSSKSFSYLNGDLDDEYYNESIYVGYRFFDTFNINPLYCFGYGKSYTNFNIKTNSVKVDDENITLSIDVKNIGTTYPGKEVVQVYYSAPDGVLKKPYQELAGFAKTKLLAPGETQSLNIIFKITSMASYSPEQSSYILEKGKYIIRVGNSSRNTTISAVLSLSETVITEKLKNICNDKSTFPILSPNSSSYKKSKNIYDSSFQLEIPYEKIKCTTINYKNKREKYNNTRINETLTLTDVKNGQASIDELISQLSVEEMAKMCVGRFRKEKNNEDLIFDTAFISVPGAAAETCDMLINERHIPNLILADGPAGLRLQTHFITTKDGVQIKGGQIYGGQIISFPKNIPDDAIHYYQYCTAIPIATNLAQSWNLELIEEMGNIIGNEMSLFHVDLWLAPGMNIHRNPLCGRNFEYYSEDPLLSGKCASSTTVGVQKSGHHGTTVKHYACNNQEDNRFFCCSHIDERALREIYLKGFEIAIKESQPYAIMTSYNLVNGIHSANQYDLIQSCLRDEWKFDGVVMTDWTTADDKNWWSPDKFKYSRSSCSGCIKAGNDLIMPGRYENVQEITSAIKDGSLLIEDLQFCVKNILKTILKCQ